MTYWIGTSGYQYPAWRGHFYPEKMPESQMLEFYSARFPTVEINYSFYRWPSEKAIEGWAKGTPENFRVIMKMNRRVTDHMRLKDVGQAVGDFWTRSQLLGAKRGPILFTLQPWVKKDVELLKAFLADLPEGFQGAMEFRSSSWADDAVHEALAAKNIALCVSEGAEHQTPVVRTADYAYFRLRKEEYSQEQIGEWAKVMREWEPACKDIYGFFMHEDLASGPRFGRMLMDELGL